MSDQHYQILEGSMADYKVRIVHKENLTNFPVNFFDEGCRNLHTGYNKGAGEFIKAAFLALYNVTPVNFGACFFKKLISKVVNKCTNVIKKYD